MKKDSTELFGKYTILYQSTKVAGGLKFIGETEDCSMENMDGIRLFDSFEEAEEYIKDKEPLLDNSAIRLAVDWLGYN